MWKLNRIVKVGFELLKANPNQKYITWADYELLDYIDKEIKAEYKYCFWEGECYIHIPNRKAKKAIYLPFKTKYNRFIIVNENEYPKKIVRLETTINLIDKIIYKCNNWIS